MKIFYGALLFILLSPVLVYAQDNFKPGYIVNLKGDTLTGLVNYREWDQNPGNVTFKTPDDVAAKTYTTADINAFGVTDNAYFTRFTVPISIDYVDVTKIGYKTTDSMVVRTVFLKQVSTGKVLNLYSYTDLIKSRYFMEDSHTKTITELVFHIYYANSNTSYPKKINRYRQQLLVVAQNNKADDAALMSSIARASYIEADLSAIVQKINQSKGASFTAQKLFKVVFFAGGSIVYSKLTFHADRGFYNSYGSNVFSEGGSSSTVYPKIGGGVDLIFNKNTQRLFFRIEGAYMYNQFKLSNSDNTRGLTIKLNTVSFTPQIVYSIYSRDNLKVFMSAGISYNINAYNNKYNLAGLSETYLNGDGTFSYLADAINQYIDFQHTTIAFPIKAGIIINKHLEFNLGYAPSSELSYTTSASISVKAYQAGFNFLF